MPISRPRRCALGGDTLKPSRFCYARVESTEEALSLLQAHGDDAAALAGGQSLMAMMNMRVVAPDVLVDLGDCAELDFVRVAGEQIEIGAMFRQAALERWHGTASHLPLLSQALPHVGHYQTRARGTVGGSLAHADPSAEIPLVAATLGAKIVLRSAEGEREVPAREFFTGPLDTVRAPEELIWAVTFPALSPAQPGGVGTAFDEVGFRRGDFAVAAFAARVDTHTVVLGMGGIAGFPLVFEWARSALDEIEGELEDLVRSLDVLSDQHADATYRRRLVRTIAPKVLRRAAVVQEGSHLGSPA